MSSTFFPLFRLLGFVAKVWRKRRALTRSGPALLVKAVGVVVDEVVKLKNDEAEGRDLLERFSVYSQDYCLRSNAIAVVSSSEY